MKILRVINSLEIGGAERSLETNVPIHNLNNYKTDIYLLKKSNTYFYNNLIRNGVKIYNSPNLLSIYNPLHILFIIPYLNKYDIIHVHLFPSLYWVSIAKIICFSNVKLIYTEHSTENKRRKFKLFKYIDRIIYNNYIKLISISISTSSNLIDHLGIKFKNRITTIYNGVNLDLFEKSKKTHIQNNKTFRILQVASFRNAKDQDTVIKALKLLPSNIKLTFAGNGERINICKELVNELRLKDRVDFLGVQNNIHAIISKCDCLVMSSKYEGFGRAAVEGMAAAKPVIATNVDGLSDIVNGYGLLFNVGDYQNLSNHILKLYRDVDYYNSISNKCFKRAKDFDVNKMISKYESIYDEVYTNNQKI